MLNRAVLRSGIDAAISTFEDTFKELPGGLVAPAAIEALRQDIAAAFEAANNPTAPFLAPRSEPHVLQRTIDPTTKDQM